ncbi:hypothetical protein IFM89_015028 [Coptis chinensis]|uniref:CO(2)-response secreted protease n=1 Tax=Coptis chinensis TaxID=261450 RepID=A0A835LMG1_9MAGN|nr:hypothetical protein IFM89_015028 [Coptis chinensis]
MKNSRMDYLLQALFTLLFCFLYGTNADHQTTKSYVVYMGSSGNNGGHDTIGAVETAHLELLSSILPSKDKERLFITHIYNHAFKGFSTMLTEKEASLLSGHDEIISVFPDPTLQLHTTRSWDFLKVESGMGSNYPYPSVSGEDVIIGIIDTGIWPESPSFSDYGIGEIPTRWKGICMEGSDFTKSNCNRKLIGARYYNMQAVGSKFDHNKTRKGKPSGSPRDAVGHGTHTASTAAGAPVANASYFGLGQGTARGGSPSSRIAAYKACSLGGCSGATILKAMDDAIGDGVDVISISIGMSSIFQSDFLDDPIAIGAFHANQKGIMVICSGGNDGPDPSTVVNSAPWIFTVAASNVDRDFQSSVVLGNGHIYKGSSINFSNLTASKKYPLAYGGDIAAPSTPSSEASNCIPGSLDTEKTTGKIVVCVDTNPMVSRRIKKLVAEVAKAKGVIMINEDEKGIPFDSGVFPFSEVGNVDGYQILKYINSTKNPTATILPSVDAEKIRPAPVVAYFSSRGPGELTETILKPDITAPGVGIVAAMIPKVELGSIPYGKKSSKFGILSGTSMACPHVAGAAAFIKSVHPSWSPSMIKSALMTTATTSNNMGKPITNSSDGFASPHDTGAGEISPLRALNPGLVYETRTTDYLYFLCYYGYKDNVIHSVSGNNFTCPKNSSEDLISDLNYPSISISKLEGFHSVRTITRTVTNVGSRNSTYIVNVDSPISLGVIVSPKRLMFSGPARASFRVSFYNKGATKGYKFGSITWSDGIHSVRTTFAVNVV